MNPATQVFSDVVPVAGRLHELEVSQDVLQEALMYGLRFGFECTGHDPPSLKGILVWGKISRALRDRLVPAGWKPNNMRNYATVIHPDDSYAIAVAAGDWHTGMPNGTPTTRVEKGPATEEAVAANQLSFADISRDFPKAPSSVLGITQTWLLLHYVDEEAAEIRWELSLPDRMVDGFVSAFRERILLPPVALDKPTHQSVSDTDAVDVNVIRRKA